MLARAVLLAVPSLAMAVVGFAILGPGAARSFDGVQLWGGPTENARTLSWRVLALERFRGIDSTKNVGSIVVRARLSDGSEVGAECTTRRDGTCDVALALTSEARGLVHADVTTSDGSVTLASGDFARDAAFWDRGPPHPQRLPGEGRGDLSLAVRAARGIFAAPFRDELVVTASRGRTPVRGAKVSIVSEGAEIEGASLGSPGGHLTSDRGDTSFALHPLTHTVEATIEVTYLGLTTTWDGVLPVVPGAMWLDPSSAAGQAIRIVSPVGRELAFATLSTRTARLWGGVIPLSADTRGFTSGEIRWPLAGIVPTEPMWITLSSDPRGTGLGTVGWPIAKPSSGPSNEGELAFRDWLLLDGMPAAERRDASRRGRARLLAVTALGAAAIIEGVLLARGSYGKGARPWLWALVAIATTALAFAAIAVVTMWKIG